MKSPAINLNSIPRSLTRRLISGVCIGLAFFSVPEPFRNTLAQTLAPLSRRAQLSPERALRMEALLLKMFPGATLDWNTEQIVYPDVRRQGFNFGLFEEKPQRKEGATLLIASPMPEDRHAKAIEQMQSFRGSPVDIPRCKLYLMRVDTGGKVLGFKESVPDLGDFATTCDRANFGYAYDSAGVVPPQYRGQPESAWPWVVISYTSYHSLPDAWATVTWAAVLDTETMQWVNRVPVFFEGMRRDRKSAAFAIRNDRGATGGGQWLFSGFNDGDEPDWQLRRPCKAGSCKVEASAVIDAAFQRSARK